MPFKIPSRSEIDFASLQTRIKLTQGIETIVDTVDYIKFKLENYTWHLSSRGYAATNIKIGHNQYRYTLLSRFITKPKRWQEVDHKNSNTLDNRRDNLRICNKNQNQHNAIKHRNGITSRYKGVYWSNSIGKFKAQITINHNQIDLGSFDYEGEAACAYNAAARKFHKEFALLNII